MAELNGGRVADFFTENTEITLYANCMIQTLAFQNNTNGAVIEDFKIGITPNGSEIFGPVDLTYLGKFSPSLGELPLIYLSQFEDTPIYLSATNFNGCTLAFVMIFKDLS